MGRINTMVNMIRNLRPNQNNQNQAQNGQNAVGNGNGNGNGNANANGNANVNGEGQQQANNQQEQQANVDRAISILNNMRNQGNARVRMNDVLQMMIQQNHNRGLNNAQV